MELLDRYLQAVRKQLLWGKQDDIIAELRANLEAQLEEREEALGRPLTQGEAEDWLRELGPPAQVAGRYLPQQYLIGPTIFPLYVYVLRLVLGWAALVYSIVSLVVIITQWHGAAGEIVAAVLRLPFVLLQVALWVTFVAVVVEFVAARSPNKIPPLTAFYGKWSPRDLPPLEPAVPAGCRPKSYAQAVAEVIFGFLGLAWLLAVPTHPFLMFGPSASFLTEHFRLADIWIRAYWWCIGVAAAQLLWQYTHLVRGLWPETGPWPRILLRCASLIPPVLLLSAPGGQYFLLKDPVADLDRYGQNVHLANMGLHFALEVICAIIAVRIVWEVVMAGRSSWRRRAMVW